MIYCATSTCVVLSWCQGVYRLHCTATDKPRCLSFILSCNRQCRTCSIDQRMLPVNINIFTWLMVLTAPLCFNVTQEQPVMIAWCDLCTVAVCGWPDIAYFCIWTYKRTRKIWIPNSLSFRLYYVLTFVCNCYDEYRCQIWFLWSRSFFLNHSCRSKCVPQRNTEV